MCGERDVHTFLSSFIKTPLRPVQIVKTSVRPANAVDEDTALTVWIEVAESVLAGAS